MDLYLSPHLDDAVLSCGGAIAAQRAAGEEVVVVTVCSGAPPAGVAPSKLAEELHALWGLDLRSVNRVRRGEDDVALNGLGAKSIQLDFLEAIYRLPSTYDSYDALFGEVAANDGLKKALAARLAPILDAHPDAAIYAPLSVGGHVDHRIVHEHARSLAERRTVCFYEEIPYVLRAGELERCLAGAGGKLWPKAIDISGVVAQKLRAITCYASQLHVLFGSVEAMPDKVLEHARAVAEVMGLKSSLAERVWCAAR